MVVVQRYGDGVAGGAEAHARSVVQRLAPHFAIEVVTTTAQDYWTWDHVLAAGTDKVDDVPVRRFRVEEGRARDFRRYERAAFSSGATLDDERGFVRKQGPYVPELLEYVHERGREVDHALFFTYIYLPTALGLPLIPDRAVLVPTAHEEPAIRLSIYRALFHAPRAIAFNTEEERAMVQRIFRNARIPNDSGRVRPSRGRSSCTSGGSSRARGCTSSSTTGRAGRIARRARRRSSSSVTRRCRSRGAQTSSTSGAWATRTSTTPMRHARRSSCRAASSRSRS